VALRAALASLMLMGCRAGQGLPNMLYPGVGVNPDETLDSAMLIDIQQRLGQLETGFRQIHPNVRFQISLYPEQQLAWAIQRRNRAGLGPDLLLTNGDTALQLLRAGLVKPFP
jgi:arabinogalactan oligomer/maltooligosaccharide transport system substrate-binding protein